MLTSIIIWHKLIQLTFLSHYKRNVPKSWNVTNISYYMYVAPVGQQVVMTNTFEAKAKAFVWYMQYHFIAWPD